VEREGYSSPGSCKWLKESAVINLKSAYLMTPSYQPRGIRDAHDIEVPFPPSFVTLHTSFPISDVFEISQWLRRHEQIDAAHGTCCDVRALLVVHEAAIGVKFEDAWTEDETADQDVGEGAEEVPWGRWVKTEKNLQCQEGKLYQQRWGHFIRWILSSLS